jgi:hypothetical protein
MLCTLSVVELNAGKSPRAKIMKLVCKISDCHYDNREKEEVGEEEMVRSFRITQ